MSTHPFRRLLTLAAVLSLAACSETTLNATVASLRFLSLPTSAVAGEPFTVEIELLNPSGERASDSRASVVIRLVGTATLSGETTVEASQGVATFEGLELTIAGTTIILEAEAATFTAQSAQFAVAPAAPSGEQSTATAPATPLFPFGPTQLTFTFKDAFGNVLAQKAVSVTASQAGSTLTPSSGTTNAAGVFVSEFLPSGEGSLSFAAVVGGTSITLGSTFAIVDPCPPTVMTFPGVTQGAVPVGNCAIDGNPATAYRFTTAALGGASFSVNAGFQSLVEVQTDPPTANVTLAPLGADPVEWLLPAGTYRFRIGSAQGPGAFSVTGAATAGNSDGVARALVTPGVYGGQVITEGDVPFLTPDGTPDGTFIDFYFFISPRPCSITMTSAGFEAWLAVLGAVDGADPDFFEIGTGNPTATVTLPSGCRSPSGAPLLIVANNFFPAFRGAYTLTIELLPSTPASGSANARSEQPRVGSSIQPLSAQTLQRLRTALRRR